MSRTRKTLTNSITSIVGRMITLVLSFIVRIIFVKYLNEDLLGINGLFTNVIQVLSFAELGVGTAFTFALYKPLAEKDSLKLSALMGIFKKTYIAIGVVVFTVGISLISFLHIIIKDNHSIDNLETIYILFILNTSISYFFSYNRSMLIADQKLYVATFVQNIYQVLMSIFQIIILIVTKNYYLFLVIQILSTLLQNITLTIIVKRQYPDAYFKKNIPLETSDKKRIIESIKGLIISKLGTIAVLSTDNIIISSFIGIGQVGVYSNYVLIVNSVKQIVNLMFSSAIASIGNLNVTSNTKHLQETYKKILFLVTIVTGFSSICIYNMLNPTILFFFGKDYLLSRTISLLITVEFYTDIIRLANLIYSESLGLFWHTRYKSLLEGAINLVISVMLVSNLGISGVLIGTISSKLLISLWYEPYILYRNGLDLRIKYYIDFFLKNMIITLLIGIFITTLNDSFFSEMTNNVVLKMVFTILTTSILYLIIYRRNIHFSYFKNLFFSLLKK